MGNVSVLLGVFLAVVLWICGTIPTLAAPQPLLENGIHWYNAKEWGVSGKGWTDTSSYYDRLPARAQGNVPSAVWTLSRQSAGMYVEFETDSTTIHARWYLTMSRLALPHMAATGVSGVDLYAMDDSGEWRWLFVGKPETYPKLEQQLVTGLAPGFRKYRLYLPLYNGVSSVEIGVSANAKFVPVAPAGDQPIVFYGTSITQGAVASRPGMSYTAILGRRLGVPVINLGFSGNGKMEPELAMLLAELDPSIYVLDAIPNMNATLIDQNFEHFVRILREARPDTPIVVVEDRAFANTPFLPARQTHHANTRLSLRAAFGRLVASGIEGLHFVSRDDLFGADNEATVDASHPTDLGFVRYSDIMEPVLRSLLDQ